MLQNKLFGEMMAIDLTTANLMLDEWLNAEKSILKNQSYQIGDKELKRVDMKHVRENIRYWENKVNALTVKPEGRKGIRVQYGVMNG